MKSRFLSAAVAALALCASPALGQPMPPPIAPPAVGQPPALTPLPPPIEQRVSDLERENVELKSRLAAVEAKLAAPGVAVAAPFGDSCEDSCGAGCRLILTTSATGAGTSGTILTSGPAPWGAGGTSTGVRGVVTAGGISGCSAAGCSAAVAAGGGFRGLFANIRDRRGCR